MPGTADTRGVSATPGARRAAPGARAALRSLLWSSPRPLLPKRGRHSMAVLTGWPPLEPRPHGSLRVSEERRHGPGVDRHGRPASARAIAPAVTWEASERAVLLPSRQKRGLPARPRRGDPGRRSTTPGAGIMRALDGFTVVDSRPSTAGCRLWLRPRRRAAGGLAARAPGRGGVTRAPGAAPRSRPCRW